MTRAAGHWIIDEDSQLTGAVANTSKKKRGNEYKTEWDAAPRWFRVEREISVKTD
jgi:hypothetical protein